MSMSSQIRDVLTDMGYSLRDNGKEFRTKPIYRDSGNNGDVLRINKDNGRFVDFARNISGSFEDLVKLSLGLSTIEEAKKYIENNFDSTSRSAVIVKPKIKEVRVFPPEFLTDLKRDNSYWNNRQISDDTLADFKGGVCEAGRMKNRYVFPILNSKEKLVGVSGRYIFDIPEGSRTPKWKHLGDKFAWKYPLQVNASFLKKHKKIILVESIGDMLSLWQAGVKNIIVLFGIKISTGILNTLLRLDPQCITISLNNDEGGSSAGNIAAEQARKKLLKFFDTDQVKVAFPYENDFGEMTTESVIRWSKSHG